MSISGDDDENPSALGVPDDAILQLNRAMVVLHSVRTAVHELNNVFQMISGSVELLQNNAALPVLLRPRVDAILRQSNRGQALVRGVADLARRESAGPQTVDFEGAIDQALETRRFEHRRSGISVSRASTGSGPWTLRGDPLEIQHLLLTLLINAERAAGERPGRAITLELSRRAATIELTIRCDAPDLPHAEAAEPASDLTAGLAWSAAQKIAAGLGGDVVLAVEESGQTVRVTVRGIEGPSL